MTEVTVCFYRGISLPCLAVRLDTRRPGQPLADVPAHCAVVLQEPGGGHLLHEFVSSGYRSRPTTAADFAWSRPVDLPYAGAALVFAGRCRGQRYGWCTIAMIALSRVLRSRLFRGTRPVPQHTCSWMVKAVLEAGGASLPYWLRAQYVPCSPNEIWLALRG